MSPPDQPAKAGASFNPAHLTILERYGGKRGRQALALIALGQLGWPAVKYLWDQRTKTEDFTITVPGVDDIYPDLHEWVLERIPEDERKAMIATTEAGLFSPQGGEREKDQIRLRYDGSRNQSVLVDGHKVHVAVERENMPERVNLPENWRQYMEKITFTATTAAGRDAVVSMIEGLLKLKDDQNQLPALHIPSRYGGEWTRRGDLPPRTLDSTILKTGQLNSLVSDLDRFLQDEDEYLYLNQPWHRGYLFHGAPGTGKTSVARALANHFDLPTYYLPLGDIDRDTNLLTLVASIQPRSVLLIEDVDVFHTATKRDDDKTDKSSIAGMLNALDGVYTPHGLITILTTNNREALDEALIRPGRIDVNEEFTVLDRDQAIRLIAYYNCRSEYIVSDVVHDVDEFVGRSPAELIERLTQERNNHATEDAQTLRAVSG